MLAQLMEVLCGEPAYGDYWFVGVGRRDGAFVAASATFLNGVRVHAAMRQVDHIRVQNGEVTSFVGMHAPDWGNAYRGAIADQLETAIRVAELRGEILHVAIAVVGRSASRRPALDDSGVDHNRTMEA